VISFSHTVIAVFTVAFVAFLILMGAELHAMKHDGRRPDPLITLAWFVILVMAAALVLGAST
jgi:hypothetical protein